MSPISLFRRVIVSAPRPDEGGVPSVARTNTPVTAPGSPQPPLYVTYYEVRRRRSRRTRLQFLLFVILPTAFAVFYCGFYATPRYVSQVVGQVKTPTTLTNSSSALAGNLGAAASLLGSAGGSLGAPTASINDAMILESYINSPAMVSDLQKDIDIRSIYGDKKVDFLARLPAHASREFFAWYWRWWCVDTSLDSSSGALTFYVTAFSPQDSQKIATAIVARANELLNNMSAKMREDSVSFARKELSGAEARLTRANLALKRFRNEHSDFDPNVSAGQLTTIISGLETTLAAYQAQRSGYLKYMRPDAAPVQMADKMIASVQAQIADERNRLGNNQQTKGSAAAVPYSTLLDEYTTLETEKSFALTAYNTAAADLELARQDAQRTQEYFTSFVPPTLPELSVEPDPILEPLAVFGIMLTLFGLVKLVLGGFREHLTA